MSTDQDLFARHYVDAHAPDRARRLATRLATSGLATFDDIDEPETLLALASDLCVITPHRDSDPDGLTAITDTAAGVTPPPGYRAFSTLDLHPHTDGTAHHDPPELLWLVCAAPAEQGGASVLVDGATVYAALKSGHPAELHALTTAGLVAFGAQPARAGAVFEPARTPGRVRVRFRNDELVETARPAAAAWPVLLEAITSERQEVRLTSGQGFVARNSRWLHGRTAFTGSRRRMWRLLGQPHERLRIPDGFVPASVSRSSALHC